MQITCSSAQANPRNHVFEPWQKWVWPTLRIVTGMTFASIGEHQTNRLGSTKKRPERKFVRAFPKSRCQSLHRLSASRNLTLLIFAGDDVVRILSTGWNLQGLSALPRMGESGETIFARIWFPKKQPQEDRPGLLLGKLGTTEIMSLRSFPLR
jgi:hypothetical protein